MFFLMKKRAYLILLFYLLIQCSQETNSENSSDSIKNSTLQNNTTSSTIATQENSEGANSSETTLGGGAFDMSSPVILAYFPSWLETIASKGQNSKLREIPSFVNHVFLAFAKPNLRYTKGSYDISQTGIDVPYDGCTLKESISALKQKNINVVLSLGGETYWGDTSSYEIEYQQIKDLVDDLGFVGIDWDFEPEGSFAQIGSQQNIDQMITFFEESRKLMPKEEGYLLACAPAGVGALGGSVNDDPDSPYRYANRNTITGETDAFLFEGTRQTNGINLFGFGATGHMIPVIKSVGNQIDLIAFQGYNTGGSRNRKLMYDAYSHYAQSYGFLIAAGIHYPPEPWGPYYNYTHENVASLSSHILNHPIRNERNDGIMIWQLLLKGNESSSYSYLNVASQVLNGKAESDAIVQGNNFDWAPYTGGASNCETQ